MVRILDSVKHTARLLPVACLLAGCSTLNTHVEPKTNLAGLKEIYVQTNLNENHGMDAMIVRDLRARGIKTESGPMTLMPPSATAYLTYQDQWEWDFKDSLIALNLTLRDANTDEIIASVNYFRPTAFMKSPRDTVKIAVTALLAQKSASSHPGATTAPKL